MRRIVVLNAASATARGDGGRLPGEVGAGSLEYLDLHLQHPVAAAQLDKLLVLVCRDTGLATGVDRVAVHPVPQAGLADPEITGGLADRIALGNQIQSSTPELRRVGSRHLTDSFRDDHRLNSGVRETGSGSPT